MIDGRTKVDFLRKINNTSLEENGVVAFHFPRIPDKWTVDEEQIIEKLKPPFKEHREKFYYYAADITSNVSLN